MEELCGDYYDIIESKDPSLLGIFISDVSGHGVPAALITAMVKILISTSGNFKLKPSKLLKYLNNSLIDQTCDHFLTAFYATYNIINKIFTYSIAAHPSPILIRDKKVQTIVRVKLDALTGVELAGGAEKECL